MSSSGYVYLLVQIDSNGLECHKIGISKNDPFLRLKQLKTGNSNEIRLLNFYNSVNYEKIERLLHKRFKYNRTLSSNEWFNLPNDFVLNFKKECEKIDEVVKFLKEENHFYN